MNQYHEDFLLHLSSRDPILHKVVMQNGPILLPNTDTPFRHLVRIIAGQQLSVRAAATIYGRIEEFLGNNYTPERVLESKDEDLRSLGLSNSKVKYVKSVAEAAGVGCDNFSKFTEMSDEEVIQVLTEIKGIGVWSAHMFLMSNLKRPDVFAPGDLGLKKAMCNLYGYEMDGPEKLWDKRAENWSPYRTLASLHLWRSLENT